MIARTGLRLRIAAAIVLIVLVAVAALGTAVHQLVVSSRVAGERQAADDRIAATLDIYESTGLLSFDATTDDPSLPRSVTRSVRHDGERATLVEGGSTRVVWAAGRTGGTVLSTRTTFAATDSSVRAVDRALLVASLATVLLASLVGLLSANQLARRLRVAARTARALAGGADPGSLRSAVGRRRDEVGDLADAVDTLTERLDARLLAERRFTADVAHDLRTPVTGLLTAAALLEDSRPAELVRERAETLRALVEELLEVARLDSGAETAELEHVRLADVLDRTVARGLAAGEYDATQVLLVPAAGVPDDRPGATILTDPRRLDRVVSNLVRNAVRHGGPPVEVSAREGRVTVRDHGRGFPPEMIADGPQRFRRRRTSHGTEGNGLGLVIAAGQSAVLGGTLRLSNASDGGAVATLDLPVDTREPQADGEPDGSAQEAGRTWFDDLTDRSRPPHENETRS